MKYFVMLLLLAAQTVSAQTIYKIVKADGTVLYTDVPQEGAQAVELAGNTDNVANSLPVPDVKAPPQEKPKPDYQVSITSPEPEASIRDNQGNFSISASVTPAYKGRYRLTFDGQALRMNNSGQFRLTGINRGAHTYHIDIIDNTGKTLASSPQQTLYLHQASVLINNN